MNRLNKTESAVYLYCCFSLFLKDLFSRLLRGRNSCRRFCVELVKLLLVYQYSVSIFFFLYSGPPEYWLLTETRIPLKWVLEGVRIVAFFHKFSMTDSIKRSMLFSNIVGPQYF